MWWEALPSGIIVAAAFALTPMYVYVTNRIFLGTPYNRSLSTQDDVLHTFRDRRLTGLSHPYKQLGLSNLEEICSPPPKPAEEDCTCPPKKTDKK